MPYSKITFFYISSFASPHHEYGNIIYGQHYNSSFHQKIEFIQDHKCLAILGAMSGTSKEKLYEKVGLELFNFPAAVENYVTFENLIKINLLSIL